MRPICMLKRYLMVMAVHVAALERALNGTSSTAVDEAAVPKGKWTGPEGDTIQEEAEPTTPGPSQQSSGHLHQRERAEDGD